MPITDRDRWLSLAVTVFLLNLVWENAHGVLYAHAMPGWRYLQAAGGDVLLVGLGVAVAWPARARGSRTHAAVLAVALTAIAVLVELLALAEGRWAYEAAMPTLGAVGLSPLLQLPVTGVVAWWIVDRLALTRRELPTAP